MMKLLTSFMCRLDVMAMQAAPVVCIMVGVVLPAVLPLTIKSHGLATSYYHGTTFYATAGVTFSTLLDMWFGSLPTRLSYILFPTILSGAVAIGAGKKPFPVSLSSAIPFEPSSPN